MALTKKKNIFRKLAPFIIIIALFLLGFFYLQYLLQRSYSEHEKEQIEWEVKGRQISLEIADSSNEWYQGLSNRDDLCENCGMLFVFPEIENKSFVMRNMNFPLDIVFIRSNMIVSVYSGAEPEGEKPAIRYNSLEPVNYVLELNSGVARDLGLNPGDVLELPEAVEVR
jgi:uncharacterized membrane protein (UPF0127 family)